jgi:hypothetical protein
MTSLCPLLVATAASLLCAAGTRGETWLPLDNGFTWSYSGPAAAQTLAVEGNATVLGRAVKSIHYSPSTENPGLRNFWSHGPDGDVVLHGFDRPGELAFAYEPPIVILDVPPTVGQTWQQTIVVRDLFTSDSLYTFDVAFHVFAEQVVVVPAGTFDAIHLGQVLPTAFAIPGGGTIGLDGARSSEMRGGVERDFAENVGVVRDPTAEASDLVSYGSPTAVAAENWGRLKNLYR